jgi:hypothetical protein
MLSKSEFDVLSEIAYDGFAGTIFEHALFLNKLFENFKNHIDIEKTNNQTVYSSRLNKKMILKEYLENHLLFQEEKYEQDGYNYYCPQSPLLSILEN